MEGILFYLHERASLRVGGAEPRAGDLDYSSSNYCQNPHNLNPNPELANTLVPFARLQTLKLTKPTLTTCVLVKGHFGNRLTEDRTPNRVNRANFGVIHAKNATPA